MEEFKHKFRFIAAENILKKFDGELTLQVAIALDIADRRLASKSTRLTKNVTEDEWKILQMSKEESQSLE